MKVHAALALLASAPTLAQDVFVDVGLPMTVAGVGDYAVTGWAVAADGDTVLVGAPTFYDPVGVPGRTFVFERHGGVWSAAGELAPSSRADRDTFGTGMDLVGDLAVVGSPWHPSGPRATVFERIAGVWVEVAELTPPDPLPGDSNGDAGGLVVAIAGGRILLGDPRGDLATQADVGAVYVFERVGGVWSPTQTLHSPQPTKNTSFGQTLAADGDTVLVGEHLANPPLGQAHVFRGGPGALTLEATLVPDDPGGPPPQWFGYAVALEGHRAVVSAPLREVGGGAYVFERTGGTWETTAVLASALCAGKCWMGFTGGAVTLDAERIVLGEPFDDSVSVWIHEPDGSWSERHSIQQDDPAWVGQVGHSVALDGTTLVVGAPIVPLANNSGGFHILELGPAGSYVGDSYCHGDYVTRSCPCGFDSAFPQGGGCRTNSATPGERGGLLIAHGSASVSQADLALTVVNLPKKAYAFAMRAQQAKSGTPFGHGRLCLAGGLLRSELAQAGTAGSIEWDPTSKVFGGAVPGTTLYFQAWYRDAQHCGYSYNLTNAVAIDFVP